MNADNVQSIPPFRFAPVVIDCYSFGSKAVLLNCRERSTHVNGLNVAISKAMYFNGDFDMIRMNAVWVGIILWTVARIGLSADPPKVIAEGDWSNPVADTRGFEVRGRLVLCEKPRSDDRREIAVYVELQDARESIGGSMRIFCDFGKSDYRPEYKGGLQCQLQDKDKNPVNATSYPFGGGIPVSEWVTLPTDATLRLRASPFGIRRANAMAISPQLGQLWVIGNDDASEYFLSGTFTVDPDAGRKSIEEPHIWRGTIGLPAVRIVNKKR